MRSVATTSKTEDRFRTHPIDWEAGRHLRSFCVPIAPRLMIAGSPPKFRPNRATIPSHLHTAETMRDSARNHNPVPIRLRSESRFMFYSEHCLKTTAFSENERSRLSFLFAHFRLGGLSNDAR
jgi:hypothetical protein